MKQPFADVLQNRCFKKCSQNSHENAFVGVSFLIKFVAASENFMKVSEKLAETYKTEVYLGP